MSKLTFYVLETIWIALLIFSLWKHSWVVDIIAGGSTMLFGVTILICAPKDKESRRTGYRVFGVALIFGGILAILIAFYPRTFAPWLR